MFQTLLFTLLFIGGLSLVARMYSWSHAELQSQTEDVFYSSMNVLPKSLSSSAPVHGVGGLRVVAGPTDAVQSKTPKSLSFSTAVHGVGGLDVVGPTDAVQSKLTLLRHDVSGGEVLFLLSSVEENSGRLKTIGGDWWALKLFQVNGPLPDRVFSQGEVEDYGNGTYMCSFMVPPGLHGNFALVARLSYTLNFGLSDPAAYLNKKDSSYIGEAAGPIYFTLSAAPGHGGQVFLAKNACVSTSPRGYWKGTQWFPNCVYASPPAVVSSFARTAVSFMSKRPTGPLKLRVIGDSVTHQIITFLRLGVKDKGWRDSLGFSPRMTECLSRVSIDGEEHVPLYGAVGAQVIWLAIKKAFGVPEKSEPTDEQCDSARVYLNFGLWYMLNKMDGFEKTVDALASRLAGFKCKHNLVWRELVHVDDHAFNDPSVTKMRSLTEQRARAFNLRATEAMNRAGILVIGTAGVTARPKGLLPAVDFNFDSVESVCLCRDDKRHTSGEVTRAIAWLVLRDFCALQDEEHFLPPYLGNLTGGEYCKSIECCRSSIDDGKKGEQKNNCKGRSAITQGDIRLMNLFHLYGQEEQPPL